MNKQLANEYARIRARQGLPAAAALQYARYLRAPHRAEFDDDGRAEWRQAGFMIRARIVPDDSADTSYLGEYTDTWNQGAILRHNRERGEYRYFLPFFIEAEHYDALRKLKFGRAEARRLARSYVVRDYERMEALNRGDWCFMCVDVIAYRGGVELGRSSLCGIESDSDRAYFAEVAEEHAAEAIGEARAALKRIRR